MIHDSILLNKITMREEKKTVVSIIVVKKGIKNRLYTIQLTRLWLIKNCIMHFLPANYA